MVMVSGFVIFMQNIFIYFINFWYLLNLLMGHHNLQFIYLLFKSIYVACCLISNAKLLQRCCVRELTNENT